MSRARTADRHINRRVLRPFVGVDGEGGDINGKHEYLLLRAGKNHALETGEPLTSYECFAFLADLPKDVIYVSFAFNYDVSMMLRHLHPSKVAKLFNRKAREITKDGKPTGRYFPVAVGHGEYEIDYMPNKEFRVRRPGEKWTVISDTFTFFQTSFVKSLLRWYADDASMRIVIDKIAEGKEMRHDFGAVTEYEREYNTLEVIVLAQLMEMFRDTCHALDIYPTKWQGPGNLVTAVFKREGLPTKFDDMIPEEVWHYAQWAYYGGRFECSTFGQVRGPVYQYDINSAYAAVYKDLPCLLHGTWSRTSVLPENESGAIYFADISFHHVRESRWYTLPVRSDKGTLLFPRTGRGWYWCHELEVARQYCDIEIHGGWIYEKRCECTHFDWVYRLYAERDRVGKDTAHGKLLKIVLATIYGKLAQSKGNPVFANPIWSGLVVSACRAKLISAALQDGGDDVLMLATDGLFCTSPKSLRVGKALGEWTLATWESLFIVQSGLYFLPGDKPKTRGVPQAKVIEHEQDFRRTWAEWIKSDDITGMEPFVTIAIKTFIGGLVAFARGKPWLMGTWQQLKKRVSFDWTTKRTAPRVVEQAIVTNPVEGSRELVSAPSKYLVGGRWPERDDFDLQDNPDWADVMTEDEYA